MKGWDILVAAHRGTGKEGDAVFESARRVQEFGVQGCPPGTRGDLFG
jgi:hypothetical protein